MESLVGIKALALASPMLFKENAFLTIQISIRNGFIMNFEKFQRFYVIFCQKVPRDMIYFHHLSFDKYLFFGTSFKLTSHNL